jgi:hypothetical protein
MGEVMVERNTLKKVLPICVHCKKIRDGNASWKQIEKCTHELSGVAFIHSFCPECFSEYHPEENKKTQEDALV